MKAMILAAGQGRRLQPITHTIPKPLIPVGQYTLIEHNLIKLQQTGIKDIVINVCHLAEKIIQKLGDGNQYGLHITYSYENGQALGTGGGVYQALQFLGNDPFVLMSADIWSDYQFTEQFLNADGLIHLVMVDNPSYHPQGDYSLDAVSRLGKTGGTLTYAGIAKIDPKLFANCDGGEFSLAPLFSKAIQENLATGEHFHGAWSNVGTKALLDSLRETIAEIAHPSDAPFK